jgi:hypothetical protein
MENKIQRTSDGSIRFNLFPFNLSSLQHQEEYPDEQCYAMDLGKLNVKAANMTSMTPFVTVTTTGVTI